MPTFKILVLPHQKKEDGSYNVKIRITHNRQSRYIKTPYFVSAPDVSRKKEGGVEKIRIKNQAILDKLDETVLEYKKKLLEAGMQAVDWDIDKTVSYITNTKKEFRLDFIKYARGFADSIEKQGRHGTAGQYRISINALVRFVGSDTLDINDINVSFLKAFESHLISEPVYKGRKKGVSVPTSIPKAGRAISNYMAQIKTVHEMAKNEFNDEENRIINIPLSPFNKYKIPAKKQSRHRVLSIELVQRIINLPYKEHKRQGFSEYNMAKDVFVLSFALMGINTADLYDALVLAEDVIVYNRKKTRTRRNDNAEMKVKVESVIIPLLKKYKGEKKIFSFGEHYSKSTYFNKVVNLGLKKIGKDIGVPDLTFYHARHSMASICANKLGIDIARVDEMLNHSDPKLALARVYIERDFTPLWEANRRLIALFDWGFYAGDKIQAGE